MPLVDKGGTNRPGGPSAPHHGEPLHNQPVDLTQRHRGERFRVEKKRREDSAEKDGNYFKNPFSANSMSFFYFGALIKNISTFYSARVHVTFLPAGV